MDLWSWDDVEPDSPSGASDATDDVSESENESASKPEVNLDASLLLASLLAEKCSLYVKDPNDSKKLFEGLCSHLSEYGVLSDESHKAEFSDSRNHQMEILKEIMKAKAQDTMLLTSPDENLELTEKDYALQNGRYRMEFQEIGQLGKGGFGSVFKVKHKLDGSEYAVKKIRPRSKEKLIKLLREVKALAQMKHKTIVGYNAAWLEQLDSSDSGNIGSSQSSDSQEMDSTSTLDSEVTEDLTSDTHLKPECINKNLILYIHMELCSHNLQEWLNARNADYKAKGIGIGQANLRKRNVRIFREILIGVNFIHTRSHIHRDLKPQNIFLTGKFEFVKIGDFGLAKDLLRGDCVPHTPTKEDLAVPLNFCKHTKNVGTPTYASPEQLEGLDYDFKSDMYSLGVILFEMYNIFNTDMERFKEITLLRDENKCSATFREIFGPEAALIDSLVDPVASRRPLASVILKHRLFRKQASGDAKQRMRKRPSRTFETQDESLGKNIKKI